MGRLWASPEGPGRDRAQGVVAPLAQAPSLGCATCLTNALVPGALVAAQAEADSANRSKSDFLLNRSHELRSPLSSILGFTQLIEGGKPRPTPAQQDSVEQILQAGWYLLGLVDEMLDLTSIESGNMVLTSRAIPLAATGTTAFTSSCADCFC